MASKIHKMMAFIETSPGQTYGCLCDVEIDGPRAFAIFEYIPMGATGEMKIRQEIDPSQLSPVSPGQFQGAEFLCSRPLIAPRKQDN